MHVYGKLMRDVRKIKGRLNVKLHVYFQAFKKKKKEIKHQADQNHQCVKRSRCLWMINI